MLSFSFEFWSCVEDCLLPKCRHAWWPDITLIYFFAFARSIRPSNFQEIVWQFLHNFFSQRPTRCQSIDYSAEKVKSPLTFCWSCGYSSPIFASFECELCIILQHSSAHYWRSDFGASSTPLSVEDATRRVNVLLPLFPLQAARRAWHYFAD